MQWPSGRRKRAFYGPHRGAAAIATVLLCASGCAISNPTSEDTKTSTAIETADPEYQPAAWGDITDRIKNQTVAIIDYDNFSWKASGVVLNSSGYVLTNEHVARHMADRHLVAGDSNGKLSELTLVGQDFHTDVAVLRLRHYLDVEPVSMSQASDLKVGQPLGVMGAPWNLPYTFTAGVVSSLHPDVCLDYDSWKDPPDELLENEKKCFYALQTDAAINPGNSGGGAFNAAGELVGLAFRGRAQGPSYQSNIGMNFVVPVDVVDKISKELIEKGAVRHIRLGADIADYWVTAERSDGEAEPLAGATVTDLEPGGLASNLGLQEKDTIVKMQGHRIESADALRAYVSTIIAGEQIAVTYLRDGALRQASGEAK